MVKRGETLPPDALSTRESLQGALRTSKESLADAAKGTTGWLVLSSLLVLVQACLPGAQVVLLKDLVEALAREGSDPTRTWGSLLGLTAVVGLMYPLAQVMLAATQRMSLRLRLRYRSDLAHAAARLTPSQLSRPDVTTDLEASQTATSAMDDVAGRTLQLIGAGVTSAVLCAVVWEINPVSGLFVIAALLPTIFAFTVISQTEARGWPQVAALDRRASYATEQLVQQRPGTELAVLGSGQKVASLVTARRREATRVLDRMISKAMVMEIIAALATALLFGGALIAMLRRGATGAEAAAAVAGIISGLNAIRWCGYAFGTIITAAPQARIYRQFLATIPRAEPQAIVHSARSVCLDDITFTYSGAEEPALKNVSIRADHGEIVALVGVNGAGKSTAINTLVGMLAADSGSVMIDGVDASTMTETERLGHFGLLVQEFGKFEFTLRDVIALGSPDIDVSDQDVWSALASAEAGGFTRKMPNGLDTQLGQQWGGTGVSGGEWQRLALARIYLRNAGIWILDEPTSAIDAEGERQIFTELQRTKHTRITIVVSHRAWTLKDMDRIYVIDGGSVVQEGTYADLVSQRDGRFAEIFAGQVFDPHLL
jgi:ATP-binding cassette, subfamily B, bacterial